MDLGAFFLILALALLVVVFIARPFLHRGRGADESQTRLPADHQRSELLAERDRLLSAIQELEFDHTLGKIPDEDYSVQRSGLRLAAADVLRKLDELPGGAPASGAAPAEVDLSTQEDDELEAMIQTHRRSRQEKASGFCPGCGKAVFKSDKFCSTCGTLL